MTSDCRILLNYPRQYENEDWPKSFIGAIPRVGEMVKAQSGMTLYVINVVHSEVPPNKYSIPCQHLIEIILDSGKPQ